MGRIGEIPPITIMSKITRIAYNSADWHHPTGEAKKAEGGATYNALHGFGHEDWLFRSDWLIDGWRYSFLQGINKSHAKLVKSGQPVDVTLFTKQPDKKRRYVATIRAVECLSDQQAEDALKEFKRRGWFNLMEKEICAVGGDASVLGSAKWAKHVLNVRYRLENLTRFPPKNYAVAGDPVLKLMRYMLYDQAKIGLSKQKAASHSRQGSAMPPVGKSFRRSAVAAVECTPEHARMQAILMKELRAEYPGAQILAEQDFIDVSVRTDKEMLLFEIKSDLDPRSVIRQALGQIMEYAYHPSRPHDLPVRLFIVGRRSLPEAEATYISLLASKFSLPIHYRAIEI